MYLDQIRNLRRVSVKELTPPYDRVDWEPAIIELVDDLPDDLASALDLAHGYTYSKFKRHLDTYIFADFTYKRSMGRVVVIKGGQKVG